MEMFDFLLFLKNVIVGLAYGFAIGTVLGVVVCVWMLYKTYKN